MLTCKIDVDKFNAIILLQQTLLASSDDSEESSAEVWVIAKR